MFLRCHKRKKDGKEHRYWSVVECHRLPDGKVAQRQVLYLGEINDSQKAGWCKMIEALEQGSPQPKQVALFPCDREPPEQLPEEVSTLRVKLNELTLHRPRQWGACWLVLQVWKLLGMDRFWAKRLPDGRKGTPWFKLLQVHLCNRMIEPGAEWFIHRHWYRTTALADLLGLPAEVLPKNALYHTLDRLLEHKDDLCTHLRERWESGEIYVLARSDRRVGKERSMRRRKLKKLWKRLGEIAAITQQSRDELALALGRGEEGRRPGLGPS